MKRIWIIGLVMLMASTIQAEKRVYFFRGQNLPAEVETIDLRPDKGVAQLALNNIYEDSESRYALFTKKADSWWQIMVETAKGRTANLSDVNSNWYLKIKMRRTVNYTLTIVLAGAGTANGYPITTSQLPADGEWHTLTIPLAQFPTAPLFSEKTTGRLLQIHSDSGYAGDLVGIDYCYLTNDPTGEDTGTVQPQKRYYFVTNSRTPLTNTPYAVVDYSKQTDIRANGWMQWSYVPFPYYSMEAEMPVAQQILLLNECPMEDVDADWFIIAQIQTNVQGAFEWRFYLPDGIAYTDTIEMDELIRDGKTWNRICLPLSKANKCLYTAPTALLWSLTSLAQTTAGEWSMGAMMLTNEPSATDPNPVVPGDPSQETRIYLLNDGSPLPENMNCVDYRLDQTSYLSVGYGNNTTRKATDSFLTLLPTNGWWSADIAAKTGVDLTMVDATWTMHTRIRTTSTFRPINLILYKESNAQLTRYQLTEAQLPTALNGQWVEFAIPMKELLANTPALINYTSRILSFHSDNGGVAGVEVSMDYLYFSHAGESRPDPQPGQPLVAEPELEPAPKTENIDNIYTQETNKTHKFIYHNNLYIRKGNKLYDLLGRPTTIH